MDDYWERMNLKAPIYFSAGLPIFLILSNNVVHVCMWCLNVIIPKLGCMTALCVMDIVMIILREIKLWNYESMLVYVLNYPILFSQLVHAHFLNWGIIGKLVN